MAHSQTPTGRNAAVLLGVFRRPSRIYGALTQGSPAEGTERLTGQMPGDATL